jgi:hypothetical protein
MTRFLVLRYRDRATACATLLGESGRKPNSIFYPQKTKSGPQPTSKQMMIPIRPSQGKEYFALFFDGVTAIHFERIRPVLRGLG